MQRFTAELAAAKLKSPTNDIVSGGARFRADLKTGAVIEQGAGGERRSNDANNLTSDWGNFSHKLTSSSPDFSSLQERASMT